MSFLSMADFASSRFSAAGGETYTMVVRGRRVFLRWDATPHIEVEVSRDYLNQQWMKVDNEWIVYTPLRDTFRLIDSINALADHLLPYWNGVFNAYGAGVRKTWSHYGMVTGHGDLGNKVYYVTVMCALQVRRDRGMPILFGLQHANGDWALGIEKTGDLLEGIMGCAWIQASITGPLADGSFWHRARQRVEIAALGVYQAWNHPMNAHVWDVHAMADRIMQLHADEMVTISLHPRDVALNLAPYERHQAVRLVHLQVTLLFIGKKRIYNNGRFRVQYQWLKALLTRYLVEQTV
jgi:hypothetical protein